MDRKLVIITFILLIISISSFFYLNFWKGIEMLYFSMTVASLNICVTTLPTYSKDFKSSKLFQILSADKQK